MNSTVSAIESLHDEISSIAMQSIDEGREHLNDLEIEHKLDKSSCQYPHGFYFLIRTKTISIGHTRLTY